MVEKKTIWLFLILRMIAVAFVVGAGIMIIQVTNESFPTRPLYFLLAVSVFTGLAFYAGIKVGVPIRPGLWAIMVTDIFIEAAVIHYSGGISSQFSIVYSLTIVAAAFLLEMPGGLATAIIASLCFIGYGIGESIGMIVPPGKDLLRSPMESLGLLDTYMHVSLFFLVGTVGGYLARRTQMKGRLLESAETELQQLKVDTDYILKNMSSGILVIDSNSTVITMNPAAEEILGVDRQEIMNRPLGPALTEQAPELTRELLDALDAEQSKLRHQITIQPGGDKTPLGTSISLLRDAEGRKRGVISVFQDLTEVHEMRERVRKADRLVAIGELSAGIAHELRNPLASISGSIEMLAGELELSGEHRGLMDLITRESDRLDRIISDFLEFARLRYPTRGPVDIGVCIEEVLVLLRHNSSKTNDIDVSFVNADDLPSVRADDEQLRQVFFNLAVNSCEAMEAGGKLEVVTSADDGESVTIAFCDNGPGIVSEDVGKLFEPFFTTKVGGTGLGLAIANKIVTAHGGTIEFRNRPNGGAEFIIVLPVGRIEGTENKKTGVAEPSLANQS